MSHARDIPCPGRCGTFTRRGELCSNCTAPAADDRWAGFPLAKQARTVTTPETRRMGTTPGAFTVSAAQPRSELPTLDAIPVNRHAAINRVADAIASGALTDASVIELLGHLERLRGAA